MVVLNLKYVQIAAEVDKVAIDECVQQIGMAVVCRWIE